MSFFQRILSIFSSAVPGGEQVQQAADVREKVASLKKQIQEGGFKQMLIDEGKGMAGDELEDFFAGKAEEIFEENVGQPLRAKGVPDAVIAPVRDKAVDEIAGKLREQYDKAVGQAD